MPLVAAGQNAMLSGGLGNAALYASLHTAYPGGTGTSEVTGGSPAYARQSITWNAAASGQRTNNGALTFNVPASTTVSWVGLWSAATLGTFYGSFPLAAGTPKIGVVLAGDLTPNTIESVSHGYTAGTQVTFYPVEGGSLPAGLTEGTLYYVIATGLTTDVFEVSATSGGAAVDITGEGVMVVQSALPETFAGQGTQTINNGGLVLDATLV